MRGSNLSKSSSIYTFNPVHASALLLSLPTPTISSSKPYVFIHSLAIEDPNSSLELIIVNSCPSSRSLEIYRCMSSTGGHC